jgi:translation initiation factor 2 beta subunit (eIF-2beta)/eIF-5
METCEACRSEELQLMGSLGHIVWLKCRDCGWQQSTEPIEQEPCDENSD